MMRLQMMEKYYILYKPIKKKKPITKKGEKEGNHKEGEEKTIKKIKRLRILKR